MVTIREMLPERRNSLPRWEVTTDDGTVIGWIQTVALRGAKNRFYRAIAVHQSVGDHVNLELSADWEERVSVIEMFWGDPTSASQHLPQHLRDA